MVTFLCIVLALLTFMMSMAILVQEPKQAGLSGSFGMGGEQMLGAGSPNATDRRTRRTHRERGGVPPVG